MIKVKELPESMRIWDVGLGYAVNSKHLRVETEPLKYVFLRDDGWSIACTERGFQITCSLWPEYWKEIYKKED